MEDIDISLFPHNEEAYESLCASLENYPLAFIEHATGTGKSFILLKYLYTKMRKKGYYSYLCMMKCLINYLMNKCHLLV